MTKRAILRSASAAVLLLVLFVSSPIHAARLLTENFESLGYEVTSPAWSEAITSGNDGNEDYGLVEDSQGFIPPGTATEGFRAYCVGTTNCYTSWDYGSNVTTASYIAFWYKRISSGLAASAGESIAHALLTGTTNYAWRMRVVADASSNLFFRFQYYSNSSGTNQGTDSSMAVNIWYLVEAKYNPSNHTDGAHWKITRGYDNSVLRDEGFNLVDTHRAGVGKVSVGMTGQSGTANNNDALFDLVAFNDDTGGSDNSWVGVGSEHTYSSTPTSLRPNTYGTYTMLKRGGSSPAATNWQSVDETSANDDTDFVYMGSWQRSTSYALGDYVWPTDFLVMDGTYRWRCSTGGTSGTAEPSNWAQTTVTDNTVTWSRESGGGAPNGLVADTYNIIDPTVGSLKKILFVRQWIRGKQFTITWPTRANSTAYSLGDIVQLSTAGINSIAFQCTTAGTTASSESTPNWDYTLDGTTTDGTVVWIVRHTLARTMFGLIFTNSTLYHSGTVCGDSTFSGSCGWANSISFRHDTYSDLYWDYDVNPYTQKPWTWAEVHDLQIGMAAQVEDGTISGGRSTGANNAWHEGGKITQTWIDVFGGPASYRSISIDPVTGGITNTQLTVKVRAHRPSYNGDKSVWIKLKYCLNSDCSGSENTDWWYTSAVEATSSTDWTQTFTITSLTANTIYYLDAYTSDASGGTYHSAYTDNNWATLYGEYPHAKTFPTPDQDADYDFILATELMVGGDSKAMTSIADKASLFHIDLGDTYLGGAGSTSKFRAFNRAVLSGPYLQLRKSVLNKGGYLTIWDDHEGSDDWFKTYAYKDILASVFREYRPLYTTPDAHAIYQKFKVGNAEFFMTDSRYFRDQKGTYGGDMYDGTATDSSGNRVAARKSGNADGHVTNQLYESSGGFNANTFVGDVVHNVTDDTWAIIKTKIDDTHIALWNPQTGADVDLFDTGNESYGIYESGASDHGSKSANEAAGHVQREWLIDGINNSTAKWKFLLSSVQWNPTSADTDDWGGYDPLQGLWHYLTSKITVNNVYVLEGNRHLGAIDSGVNTYWPDLTMGPLNDGNHICSVHGTWSKGCYDKNSDVYRHYFGLIKVRSDYIDFQIFDEDGTFLVGLTTTIYITDSLSLSDSTYKLLTRYITDSLSLSDSLLRDRSVSVVDSIAAQDSPLKNWGPQIADSVTLTDGIFSSKVLQILDALQLADSIMRNKVFIIPDSIGVSDSLLFQKQLIVSDAITILEQILTNKTLIFSELIQLSEAINVASASLKEVLDSIDLCDSINLLYPHRILTLMDYLDLDDVIDLFMGQMQQVLDDIGLTDSIFRNKTFSIPDVIALSETILRNKTFTLTDLINLSETVTVIGGTIKDVLDSISLSEAISTNKALTVADAIAILESVRTNKTLSVSDAVALNDAIKAFKSLNIADTISLAEIISISGSNLKEVLDSLSLTEAIQINKTLTIADIISILESIKTNKTLPVSDAVALNDAIKTLKTLNITDIVSLNDLISISGTHLKEILDSISLSEVIQRSKIVNISDTVALNEIAQALKNLIVTDQISFLDVVLAMKTLIATDTISLYDAAHLLGEVIEILRGEKVKARSFGDIVRPKKK